MGLWAKIVKAFSGKQPAENKHTNILSYGTLRSTTEDASENGTYMAAIHKYADTISKLRPELIYKGDRYRDSALERKLRIQPNPAMNASLFYKTVATSYYEENIAVIWVQFDGKGKVAALWPLDVTSGLFQLAQSGASVAFEFSIEGKTYHSTMEDTIVLVRQPTVENPYVTHDEALQNVINVLNKNYEGLAQSLQNANVAKFIATSTAPLAPATIAQRQAEIESMLNNMGANGVAYVDGSNSLTPVNSNSYKWQSSDEIGEMRKEILQYFNINDKVLDGSASDEEMHTWIEQSIEPFTYELECELTRVLLTEREIEVGNLITCPTDSLYSASFSHREKQAAALISSGVYKPNEIRRLLGCEPLPEEEGEQIVNRIDRVDAAKEPAKEDPQDGTEENQ